MRQEHSDILVIGSGIAGLSFALHCAEAFPDRSIVVLSKTRSEESNTHYAQGGIAAVMDRLKDSYQNHIDDTLIAGDGLCDREVVELVVKDAPARMQQLIDWGVPFDREEKGLELGREGGHSANRILHVKDHTGASVSDTLLMRARNIPNISLREDEFVLELNTRDEICYGAQIKTKTEVYSLQAHYTMLAGGGAGQVYDLTSNPMVATGDAMAMASEAGAELQNMAFVQFHPTVLFEEGVEQPFLISEAVRGFGAVLRNHQHEEFMFRYDARGSLATRDIVARAIFMEMKASKKEHVWLDLRHLDATDFAKKFPTIAGRVKALGIDVSTDMIPVLPAAHYFCGGVKTNLWGETSIARLMACGECTGTGLHGANRLASNSLLEALVFAHRSAEKLKKQFKEVQTEAADQEVVFSEPGINVEVLRLRLQQVMTAEVGIVRTDDSLKKARHEISMMQREISGKTSNIALRELQNLTHVSLAVIDDSLQQTQNRGGFYREDLIENSCKPI